MGVFNPQPIRRSVCPSERSEHITVARWLRSHSVIFFHVPNGGRRTTREAQAFRAMGVRAGVPDFVIIDPPPCGGYVGAVLELKKRRGGRTSTDQKLWLEKFRSRNWAAEAVAGSDAAKAWLEDLGYG